MASELLLVTTPFTQLNTPYPATPYLTGFLSAAGVSVSQCDLGIETALRLFSKEGLRDIFSYPLEGKTTKRIRSVFAQSHRCEMVIDSVVAYLQGKDTTLAHLICSPDFLPLPAQLPQEEDMEWAFGVMGIQDKARHLATLFIEEISQYITSCIDSRFGLVRYAEQMGRSASSFDELYTALDQPPTMVENYMIECLREHIEAETPALVAFSVPFPGNLFSALRCARFVRESYPAVAIAMGGGFVNTELRGISDKRFFEMIDFLMFDDGELPLLRLTQYVKHEIAASDLVRTAFLSRGELVFANYTQEENIRETEKCVPDYSGLPLDKYLSVISVTNPMHNLWSNGRWNKLTLAHGCYWGKCAFCDGTLDYIARYEPNKAEHIVDNMEKMISQTHERGFHFVDEAAPPALLREVANEILKRELAVVWWTNIRFEKSFTPDLCRLLRRSGCIAVSGGLEVASDRLLKLINKGVNLEQVVHVTQAFTDAGIMVHAYLMYGFPTQTALETINALEVVRQMFENGLIQSGFWHRFALTAHSPVGQSPESFHIEITEPPFKGFARNDLMFHEIEGIDHDIFSKGLQLAIQNYMQGVGFDIPLRQWFAPHKVPQSTYPPNWVVKMLNK